MVPDMRLSHRPVKFSENPTKARNYLLGFMTFLLDSILWRRVRIVSSTSLTKPSDVGHAALVVWRRESTSRFAAAFRYQLAHETANGCTPTFSMVSRENLLQRHLTEPDRDRVSHTSSA